MRQHLKKLLDDKDIRGFLYLIIIVLLAWFLLKSSPYRIFIILLLVILWGITRLLLIRYSFKFLTPLLKNKEVRIGLGFTFATLIGCLIFRHDQLIVIFSGITLWGAFSLLSLQGVFSKRNKNKLKKRLTRVIIVAIKSILKLLSKLKAIKKIKLPKFKIPTFKLPQFKFKLPKFKLPKLKFKKITLVHATRAPAELKPIIVPVINDPIEYAIIEECRRVQQSFIEAMRFLKERSAEKLPCYLVIGSTNAGKTQLLANSGLTFAETERFVQMTPIGITTLNSINWWFTAQAVLIDIPGHYLEITAEPSPGRAAWIELLRLLKKQRSHDTINGIIVTVDCETLLNTAQEVQTTQLQLLRANIQEMTRKLKQYSPVYIVCTKMDKIHGFHEYFADLGANERQQPWGITFPDSANKQRTVKLFEQELTNLLKRLHERVLWRLQQERQMTKRARLKEFPLQLHHLQEGLIRLVYILNLDAAHTVSTLRGIYFTSSQQPAPTLDPLANSITKNLAMTSSYTLTSPWRSDQSYFIKQLFEQTIFPEARLSLDRLQPATWHKEAQTKLVVFASGTLIIIGTTIFWGYHYRQQTADLTQAASAFNDYKMLMSSYNAQTPELDQLLPALTALRLANQSIVNARLPWLMQLQSHGDKNLASITQNTYQQQLQTAFIPALREQLLQQLANSVGTDPKALYNTLQIYLMLGHPQYFNKTVVQHYFAQNTQITPFLNDALALPLLPQKDDIDAQTIIAQTRAALNTLPDSTLTEIIFTNDENSKDLKNAAALIVTLPKILQQGNWILGNRNDNSSSINLTTDDIENITNHLKQLQRYMTKMQKAKNPNLAAFKIAKARMTNANDNKDALNALFTFAKQMPGPIQQPLNMIATNAWQLVLDNANNYIKQQWQTTVLNDCQQQLDNHYPFAASASTVTLQNFSSFLSPQGKITQFFNNYLAPFVDTTQAQWQWKTLNNLGLDNPKAALTQFERATIIQQMFFAPNNILQTNFTLQLKKVAPNNATVALTGVNNYWPEARDQQITLTLTTYHGKKYTLQTSGEWALFQWLDEGRLNPLGDNRRFDITFVLQGHTIVYQLTANNTVNPFIPNIVNQFSCPVL